MAVNRRPPMLVNVLLFDFQPTFLPETQLQIKV